MSSSSLKSSTSMPAWRKSGGDDGLSKSISYLRRGHRGVGWLQGEGDAVTYEHTLFLSLLLVVDGSIYNKNNEGNNVNALIGRKGW